MQMAQRTVANKTAASGVQRSALLPARPRSVVARFKDEDRPDVIVNQNARKVGEREDKVWTDVHQTTPTGTNENPIPVPTMKPQNAQSFLEHATDKPLYDAGEPKVGLWESAFTRRREIFAGRLAMAGFAAACFWEYILPNHPNVTQQLSYGLNLVGLNNATSATGAALIGGIVLWNTVSAFAPWSATFTEENLRDVAKRPQGPPTKWPINILGFLGLSEVGAFSKSVELFNGRIAMLGFAAAVIGQFQMGGYDGPGPVAQLAQYLGTNYEALFLSTPLFFAAWPAFWTALSFVRGKFGSNNQETEIY